MSAGSAAERVGLRSGDVITSLAGRPVRSPDDLSRIVRAHKPGDRVAVRWQRGSQERIAEVTLGQVGG